MAVTARRSVEVQPPRAIHVSAPAPGGNRADGPLTLIMGRSSLFGVNMLVTVYYVEGFGAGRDEAFERVIGIGRVVNIQANGLIQVQVLREVSNHAELWQRIRNREMAVVGQIVVKPSIDFNQAGIEVRFNE